MCVCLSDCVKCFGLNPYGLCRRARTALLTPHTMACENNNMVTNVSVHSKELTRCSLHKKQNSYAWVCVLCEEWWVRSTVRALRHMTTLCKTPLKRSSSVCSAQGQILHCKHSEPRLQFYRRQVFHHKLSNQGWSFTRDWIGAVASRRFLHPTLSLASEQTLKDLKRSRGTTWRWGEWIWLTEPSGLHQNSPQGLNIGSIRVSDQIRDPEIPITLHPY